MDFLEKDLENIIFETENGLLNERGLHIRGKKFKQIHIGNYGRLDLVTVTRQTTSKNSGLMDIVTITIFEFKKDLIDVNTFLQALEYYKGVQSWIDKSKKFLKCILEYEIVLVGKSINFNSSFVYLTDFCSELDLYTYSYDFDGITFEKITDYKLSNEGF
jgi:hypothetical protein